MSASDLEKHLLLAVSMEGRVDAHKTSTSQENLLVKTMYAMVKSYMQEQPYLYIKIHWNKNIYNIFLVAKI